jgi:hypothetical protein
MDMEHDLDAVFERLSRSGFRRRFPFLGASEDLIRSIRGLDPFAVLEGEVIGFLVAKVAEIKRQRQQDPDMCIFASVASLRGRTQGGL